MPDVDDMYNRNMLNVILDRAYANNPHTPRAWPLGGIFVQFVRLVDKSLREYDSSRADLRRYLDPTTPSTESSSYLRAADHMDNAVTSTSRSLRLAQTLRDNGFGRAARPLTARQSVRLQDFRNTLEHTDERLIKNAQNRMKRIDYAEPYAIRFGNTAMVVGKNVLRCDELVGDIRKLYRTIEAIRGPSTSGTFWNSHTRTDAPAALPSGVQRTSATRELMRLLSQH